MNEHLIKKRDEALKAVGDWERDVGIINLEEIIKRHPGFWPENDPKSILGDFRLRQLPVLKEYAAKHHYHIVTYRKRRFYNRIVEFDLPVSYYLADGDDDPTLEIEYDPITELIFPEDALLFQAILGRGPKGD